MPSSLHDEPRNPPKGWATGRIPGLNTQPHNQVQRIGFVSSFLSSARVTSPEQCAARLGGSTSPASPQAERLPASRLGSFPHFSVSWYRSGGDSVAYDGSASCRGVRQQNNRGVGGEFGRSGSHSLRGRSAFRGSPPGRANEKPDILFPVLDERNPPKGWATGPVDSNSDMCLTSRFR